MAAFRSAFPAMPNDRSSPDLFRTGRPRQLPVSADLLLAIAGLVAGVPFVGAQSQTPPPVTINVATGPVAPGFIFIGAEPSVAAALSGPEILDNQGRIVWFQAVPSGAVAADVRVQTYQGNPVLTWSQAAAYGT